ncbi:MAG: hypothetical protein JW940_32720 [Polyangiaceae bacterium]|nr:hypothetical protein [Polyangiaceae bacterium]
MVTALVRHEVRWLCPEPFWAAAADASDAPLEVVRRPAILRFATDTFMEELLAVLAHRPCALTQWAAKPETWDDPLPAPAAAASLNVAALPSTFERRRERRLAAAAGRRATPESASTADGTGDPQQAASDPRPLKLYQPAQQRFYLVAAAIVCKKPGLPDRPVRAGRQERVSYLMRRLVRPQGTTSSDPADWDEYAYVLGSAGAAWRRLGPEEPYAADEIVPNEERLPLFGVEYQKCGKAPRRLLAGVIPTGRRESYVGAPAFVASDAAEGGTPAASLDLRREVFDTRVTAPWSSLIRQALNDRDRLDTTKNPPVEIGDAEPPAEDDDTAAKRLRKASREQIQTASWYVLLDFAKFLERWLPDVWKTVVAQPQNESALYDALGSNVEKAVFDVLKTTTCNLRSVLGNSLYGDSDIATSLREALAAIRGQWQPGQPTAQQIEDDLEAVDQPYDRDGFPIALDPRWPTFLFPLSDCGTVLGPVPNTPHPPSPGLDEAELAIEQVEALADMVEAALPGPPVASDTDSVLSGATIGDARDAWFAIRCVYERPNCGPFHPPIVSHPTEPFQLASYFDPEAPARPIRIPMPLDISPAGLRKYKKNAGLIVSDLLCGQMRRIRKLTLADLVLSVLPWPFHKDLPDPGKTGPCSGGSGSFGMICSLSIPIVTLCALILLIIMVTLFDTFFRWLPLLFSCRPLLGLKGKSP